MERRKVNNLMYAIGGGTASNFGFHLMNIFFLIYCTDALGMDPVIAGTIILAARLIDTITDPLMGALADKTRSKFGKYRVWVKFAGPLMGLVTCLVFIGPMFSQEFIVIYIAVMYVVYSIVSTAANIPYHSLASYITDDVEERRTVVIVKQFSGLVISKFIQMVGVIITIDLFSGTVGGYRVLGILTGICIAVGFTICAYGARDKDNENSLELEESTVSAKELFTQITYIVRFKSLLSLVIASATNVFATSIVGAVTIYFYVQVLGSQSYASSAAMISLVVGIFGYLFVRYASKKMGNKEAFILTTSVAIICGLVLWFTFDATHAMYVVVMISVATGFGDMASLATWIMVTDCADDVKHKTGKNGAGIASSCLTFSTKLGSALGGFIAGSVVAFIGYDVSLAVQPESVITGLTATMIFAPIIGHVCSLLAMIIYPLNKKEVAKMHASTN